MQGPGLVTAEWRLGHQSLREVMNLYKQYINTRVLKRFSSWICRVNSSAWKHSSGSKTQRMTGHWEPEEKTGHPSGPGLPLGTSGISWEVQWGDSLSRTGIGRAALPWEVGRGGEQMHPGVIPAQGSSTSHPAPHHFRAFQGSRLALLPSLGWTPSGEDQEMREVCAQSAGIFSAPISHPFLRNKGKKLTLIG